MKIKCRPEDFRVEELPTVAPRDRGRFVLYRLTKRGLGTPEAIEAIRRRWDLPPDAVRHGGLKDRHALTVQYLTIFQGPERSLHQEHLDLEPVGRVDQPYAPSGFRGNRFTIVLRDLSDAEAAAALKAAGEIPRDGIPNYFDDQRFGSVGPSGDLIGRAWIAGDHERALWLALAEPNDSDRPGDARRKALLRDLWGRWTEAKAALDRSHARSIITYLDDHPTDFRGAFARLRRDLRSIYFSAYQSHLWNLILGRFIEHLTRPDQRIPYAFRTAELPIPVGLDPDQADRLASTRLPLPASRTPLGSDEVSELARSVVSELGIAWEDLRVRHLKDVFLSKGDRAALFRPSGWDQSELVADDLYPGHKRLELAFELPRGAYATLIVKRLTDAASRPAVGIEGR
ncbi:tRNA pseudouridine(13) synthase TruD [Tautonia sociabilis]|uniref:tRNA pseudouridine(13) synthase TruD n=1 Tax=Tautonia sociabilis TaxID=2080755 RepID=UPI001F20AA03|nr:tRNA pseudouridine(13) synthase TruD [Tautonia sociabilis]